MTWTPDVCIYHFPCHDGFMSSVIAWRKWPNIVLWPRNYGEPVPPIEATMGCNVLIADFSYPPDVLRSLKAKSIVVLDHHKTAEAQLAEFRVFKQEGADWLNSTGVVSALENTSILAHFDMHRSGAAMTWDFCFPGEKMPRLIEFVQDRDLWTKEFPKTTAVYLLLESYGYDYDVWNDLLRDFDDGFENQLIHDALAIERYYRRQIEEMAKQAAMQLLAGRMVPVAYVPYAFVSDVCAEMLRIYPEVDFAAAVVKSFGETTYSLRSEDRRMDVSEIAKKYGGGGHRNAAGFRMP